MEMRQQQHQHWPKGKREGKAGSGKGDKKDKKMQDSFMMK